MNTVASLPAKLLGLAYRVENLLTAWGESDEREDRDNIAAELREAAAALATPAVEGGLPELPPPAARLHVQHFRECPSMRNTDLDERVEFAPGSHSLYTAEQVRERDRMWQARLAIAEQPVSSTVEGDLPVGCEVHLRTVPGCYRCDDRQAQHATPEQPGSAVQGERKVAPWPDYAGSPIYEGDTIRHPTDGATGVVFVLANEADDHDRWRVLYNPGETPACASRLSLQIGYNGQAVVVPPAPAAEQGDCLRQCNTDPEGCACKKAQPEARGVEVAEGLCDPTPGARFGHHSDPAIDFCIEVESLEARMFDARHGIGKPGNQPESVESVREAIERALQFRVGGDPNAVAAKTTLRALAAAPERAEQPEGKGAAYGIIDPDYARVFTIARCLAWAEGYALAMHGSFTRDLDLIAVPWTHTACEPEHLARRIEDAAGLRITHPSKDGEKPHGRLVWTMALLGFADPRWIDLSIMPRIAAAPAAPVGADAEERVAKAIADVIGHGMAEKCEPHARAAIAALAGKEGA